jgi:hypothetical protein
LSILFISPNSLIRFSATGISYPYSSASVIDIEKRFLGRWKNPNYLLGANNNNQDDESMTDAEEYGYEIPVAENLMSELGDMNNMDKRFLFGFFHLPRNLFSMSLSSFAERSLFR